MDCVQSLPAGYRQIFSVDLQQDKKLSLLVNLFSLALAVPVAILGLVLVPFSRLFEGSTPQGLLLKLLTLMLGTVGYIILHELTHAAAMRAYGAGKLRFGFTGLYAYAGSEGDYFGKRAYLVIALAPLVVWGLIFALICALVPGDWFWIFWMLQFMNISGAAGDIYVALRIGRLPPDLLVRDTGLAMTGYSAM